MTDSKSDTSFVDDDEVQTVKLVKQPIDLYKILKFEGLVGSGGEAKAVIDKGLVILNTVVETQKRKKVFSGDTIEFNGTCYRTFCDVPLGSTEPDDISQDRNKNNVVSNVKPTPASTVKTELKGAASKKAGRRAIGIKC
jgi:ribosome-associated protein